MNIQVLKGAGINYDAGVKRFSGKAQLYEKFLEKFVDDPNFDSLEEALKEGNTDLAFRSSHTLKGIVGNLSMDTFYADLCELVEMLRAQKSEGVDQQFAKLKTEYEELLTVLEQE
ncbi:MAG: Hpt domain-containing protein [Hespellia sp.]|nr:Hpt domain-containing protein [Hespellia sp.]